MTVPVSASTIGIGAGPANLSVAALAAGQHDHEIVLVDRNPRPTWHDGLMFAGVELQTPWLKDLVSLVDPTNELSFLNYLVTSGRLYGFLAAQFESIPRVEYHRYLDWAAQKLGCVRYDVVVEEVEFDQHSKEFTLYEDGEVIGRSEHLVVGVGTEPRIPEGLSGADADRLVLAEHLSAESDAVTADRDAPVVVLGDGQTGAECVLELVRLGMRDVRWIGRKSWFAPLDDSPSANDLFRPSYQEFFYRLPTEQRQALVAEQVLTSDGVSMATLQQIYRGNYLHQISDGRSPVTVLPGRDVVGADPADGGLQLTCRLRGGGTERHDAAWLVVAAGRRPTPLPLSGALRELLEVDEADEPVIEPDYSARWKYSDTNKIFVQNRGRLSHGLADPNLSLLSVRGAIIVNALLGRQVHTIRDEQVSTLWR